jgi:hypothetical protein
VTCKGVKQADASLQAIKLAVDSNADLLVTVLLHTGPHTITFDDGTIGASISSLWQ